MSGSVGAARRSTARIEPRPISGAGFQRVTCTVTCVLTRFRLRSPFSLPFFYFSFRRVYRQAAKTVPGLIKAAFLLEGPRTCYTLSLWTDDNALVDFGTRVTTHVHVANRSFARILRRDRRGPELWSAQWRLWAVSTNLNWKGLDLRSVLAQQAGHTDTDEIAQGVDTLKEVHGIGGQYE